MELSGERKRPGPIAELMIRVRASGGLTNFILVKLGLGDPSNVSISRETEPRPTYRCPCCRSLTLHGRGGFEMCPVCWWEDDGQDEHDLDTMRGGPNGTLTLREARVTTAASARARRSMPTACASPGRRRWKARRWRLEAWRREGRNATCGGPHR